MAPTRTDSSICHQHSGLMSDIRHLKEGQDSIEKKLDRVLENLPDLEASRRAHQAECREEVEAEMAELKATTVPMSRCYAYHGEPGKPPPPGSVTQKIMALAEATDANARFLQKATWWGGGAAGVAAFLGYLVRLGVLNWPPW